MLRRFPSAAVLLTLVACVSPCQQGPSDEITQPQSGEGAGDHNAPPSKHVMFIIPNFRTSPSLENYAPITPAEKFKVAWEDTWDRGTFALTFIVAGESQLTNSNRAFGQGAAGFGQYLGAAYADFAIGNFMTEAIFPTILHQDPRYFRRGTGSGWSRLRYCVGQIFITHGDSGRTQFNYSEVVGNSTAVAISEAYYRDNRTAKDAGGALALQLGVDTFSNILKEFWPDMERKFRRKHTGQQLADNK
jgi:hypothetical protein